MDSTHPTAAQPQLKSTLIAHASARADATGNAEERLQCAYVGGYQLKAWRACVQASKTVAQKKNPLRPPRCRSSAPTSLLCATIGSSPKRLIDSRLPKIPNGAPQDASRPHTTLSSGPNDRSGLPRTDAVRRKLRDRSVSKDHENPSRRRHRRQTRSHTEPKDRESKERPLPVFRDALAAPIAGTAKPALATSSIARSARRPEPRGIAEVTEIWRKRSMPTVRENLQSHQVPTAPKRSLEAPAPLGHSASWFTGDSKPWKVPVAGLSRCARSPCR